MAYWRRPYSSIPRQPITKPKVAIANAYEYAPTPLGTEFAGDEHEEDQVQHIAGEPAGGEPDRIADARHAAAPVYARNSSRYSFSGAEQNASDETAIGIEQGAGAVGVEAQGGVKVIRFGELALIVGVSERRLASIVASILTKQFGKSGVQTS